MTTFLLIRHGSTTAPEVLSGRSPNVHLSEDGRRQVARLADQLASIEIDLIVASPLDRTRETAEIIAAQVKKSVEYKDGLMEIDFGNWSGLTFDQLAAIQEWKLWHEFRVGTRIPGGELIGEVQSRTVSELERLHQRCPDGTVVVVSHGDPIRAMLAYYVGLPLDNMLRLRVEMGSMTILVVTSHGAELVGLNSTY